MFKTLVTLAAGALTMAEAIHLQQCCGVAMSCCTPDCGCDEEEPPLEIADVPEIVEEVIEGVPEEEEETIIIVDDPEEPEPEVMIDEPEPDVESVPEIEIEVPEEPIEVESLPEPVKEEIKTELCALPWNKPAAEVEEIVEDALGMDD